MILDADGRPWKSAVGFIGGLTREKDVKPPANGLEVVGTSMLPVDEESSLSSGRFRLGFDFGFRLGRGSRFLFGGRH